MGDLRQAAMRELAARELARRQQAAPARDVGPVPAEIPETGPSRGEAFARGAGQGATLGFQEEGSGLLDALYSKYPILQTVSIPRIIAHLSTGRPFEELVRDAAQESVKNEDRSFGDIFREKRDMYRKDNAAAEKAHGGYYLGGSLVGGAPSAFLVPGGEAKTLGQLMVQGAKVGAATGAAYGLGSSNADLTQGQFGQAAVDTGVGALGGAALGAVAPPVVGAISYAARKTLGPIASMIRGGYVTPTPEAQRLISEGANLTLGQMDPASPLGRFEELATSKATGGSLKTLREQGNDSVRDAILKAAGAPGAKAPTPGAPVADQLQELRAGFGQVYDDALDGVKLEPEKYLGSGKWRGLLTDPEMVGAAKTKGAFEMAAGAKDIDASDGVRARALAWLTDKASMLAPTKSGPNAGKVDARAIQALRTQLRDKIRSLGTEGDDRGLREIYSRANEFVSELLEGQLPPDKANMLRSADAAYRNLLAVEDAANNVVAHRNDLKFTPAQLLAAIRNRGSTPGLEAVTRDAHSVLSATYPLTGVQSVAGEVAPVTKFVGPGFAHLSNTVPWLRAHAVRPLWTPGLPARALSATGRALEGASQSRPAISAGVRTLLDLLTPSAPPQMSLAEGEEDGPPAWAAR